MSLHGGISPDPVVSRVVIAERGIHIVKHGSGARGPFGARAHLLGGHNCRG